MSSRIRAMLMAFCFATAACSVSNSALPLSLATLQALSTENTKSIAWQEQYDGDIYVVVVDAHGDGHYHKLIIGDTSKSTAISLLGKKQAELEVRK